MFDIKLADKRISIINLYSYSEELCRNYILGVNESELIPTDMTVKISEDDIEYERRKSEQEDLKEGIPVRHFDDDYLESLAVYRKIAEKMPEYDTVLFHGSCISVDGMGFLFTAKSGTGKSTHTRLWKELLGDRAVMVNDDKPLVKIIKQDLERKYDAIAYGTPWAGKHELSCNISVPLKAVCILERSRDNSISRISKAEAYPMLMQQVYRPSDTEAMKKTLDLIDKMDVKLYRLCCNMDISAAELSYGVMSMD